MLQAISLALAVSAVVSLSVIKFTTLSEYEARLDWMPFSPAVVCICSHIYSSHQKGWAHDEKLLVSGWVRL